MQPAPRPTTLLTALFALTLAGAPASAQSAVTTEVATTIALPAARVQSGQGVSWLEADGFSPFGEPGDPQLISRTYRLVLPQACDPTTVTVQIRVPRKETVQLPAPPLACPEVIDVLGIGNLVPIPRADGAALVAGLNQAIYGTNALYPNAFLRKTRVVDQAGWTILEVSVIAARLNPVTLRARVAKEIEVRVSYQTRTGPLPQLPDNPTVKRLVLRQGIQDWNTIAQTYDVAAPSSSTARGRYLVITTQVVKADRRDNGLQAFLDHKRRIGFRVSLLTTRQIEQTYANDASTPQARIRRAIREAYRSSGTRYVLLVGNPDEEAGRRTTYPATTVPWQLSLADPSAVPMARCVTAGAGSRSDMYYMDVDGSWDPDGDGDLAERWADVGRPEVAVGRVAPVGGYVDDIHSSASNSLENVPRASKLREVFEKLIRYDLEIDKSWRYRVLLTGSYMYGSSYEPTYRTLGRTRAAIDRADPTFYGYTVFQNGQPYTGQVDEWFDGTPRPETDARLLGANRMASGLSTAYTTWCQQPAGFLLWRGHGSAERVTVGGGTGARTTYEGSLFRRDWLLERSSPSGTLPDDSKPAIVYSASCNNLSPGTAAFRGGDFDAQLSKWANLAVTLQYRGAIAVVAATHVTASDKSNAANPSIGKSTWYQRQFAVSIARGSSFGMAFLKAKQDAEAHFSGDTLTNNTKLRDWLRINFLGDPSQRMFFDPSQIPDDEYDAFESGNAPAASLQNDTRSTAATIYRGPTDAAAAPAHAEARVTGCVLKDADWYRLRNLGTRRKQVRVRVGRKRRMGEVKVRFRAADGTEIVSIVDAKKSWVTYSLTLSRSARQLYLVVRPTTHVTDYDLTVTVDR